MKVAFSKIYKKKEMEETNIIKRIDMMTKCVSLLQKRKEIKNKTEFKKLLTEIKKTEILIQTINEILLSNIDEMTKDYNDIMRLMRDKQLHILNYMIKAKKERISKETTEMQLTPNGPKYLSASDCFSLGSSLTKLPRNFDELKSSATKDNKTTPTMVLAKRNLGTFEFQFVANIIPKQFEALPKYMRGRTTCDEVQHFLNQIIIPCFFEKYKLLRQPRDVVSTKNFELWQIFQSQKSYVIGSKFITAGDISRKLGKMIDKKVQNYLIMLRHLNILSEQRANASSTVCYIWKIVS